MEGVEFPVAPLVFLGEYFGELPCCALAFLLAVAEGSSAAASLFLGDLTGMLTRSSVPYMSELSFLFLAGMPLRLSWTPPLEGDPGSGGGDSSGSSPTGRSPRKASGLDEDEEDDDMDDEAAMQ